VLDDERMQRIRDAVAEIVDDLATHRDKKAPEQKTDSDEAKENSPLAKLEKAEADGEERLLPERWRTGKPVLCIPGPSLLDEAAATMTAHLVERQGIGARAEQADALSMSRIFSWEIQDTALICLCYIEHATPAQIRYAIRRIRRRAPTYSFSSRCLETPSKSKAKWNLARISFTNRFAKLLKRLLL
jgi:hypothetical protein